MRTTDVETERLLPLFMQNEPDTLAMAKALNETFRKLGRAAGLLSVWDRIDELPEQMLDSLARDLNILWYDYGAGIEAKRNLVRSSDYVYRHMGTKSAVERVAGDYYDSARVVEWFEYDGEPYHFKLIVESSSGVILPEELKERIKQVKRAVAVMDGSEFTWTTFLTEEEVILPHQTFFNPDIGMEGV